MFIARRFTTTNNPYPGIAFVSRAVTRRTPDGPVQVTVTVPEDWDATAVDVMATKYMRRAGVPTNLTAKTPHPDGTPLWLRPRVATPEAGEGGETDARKVFERLAGCWAYWGWQLGYFDGDDRTTREDNAKSFYEEMLYMLAARLFSPNSPQWFNTGLNWAYGITAPDSGQWAISHTEVVNGGPRTETDPCGWGVKPGGLSYVRPAANACFILGVKDTLLGKGGIYDTLEREARIFKFGGGAGANFSALRGEGEPLTGGGFSSGMMSFLNTLDAGAGSIKSGGVTRRAAKMNVVNDDHPDIEEFVEWKGKEEYRAACTVTGDRVVRTARRHDGYVGDSFAGTVHEWVTRRADEAGRMGFDPFPATPFNDHFEGKFSAYQGCQGQNANNSVRVSNAFMQQVRVDGDWSLRRRTDRGVSKVIKARDLWDKICKAAWLCADPGLQFDDLWNDWNLCPEDGRINATNPCSEYGWLDDTACNLGSVRLTKYAVRGDRGQITGFDVDAFAHACGLATVALDITVGMAGYPSEEIAEGSRKYRTIGLGYCDLGAFLMQAGHAYDSDGGRAWAAALTSLMHSAATAQSAKLAAAVGTFPRYEANRQHCLRVVGNHCRWAIRVSGYPAKEYDGLSVTPPDVHARGVVPEAVLDAVSTHATTAATLAEHHGLRNAQLTLIAPTGTIGLQLGCDTTGIEPDFALVKDKKLVGGGYFKIVNQGLPAALAALNYDERQAAEIVRYVFGKRKVPGELYQELREAGVTADEILSAEAATLQANSLDAALRQAVDPARWPDLVGHVPDGFRPLPSLLWKLNPDWDAGRVAAEAAEWEAEVVGTGTVEGAPHLDPAHYDVFDCATPSGQGKRSIEPMGHVRMMAAAQPALSGGISKTINMPADSTPSDVSNVYRATHDRMVKCAALYLDGSKLSQPLNAVRGGGVSLAGVVEPKAASDRRFHASLGGMPAVSVPPAQAMTETVDPADLFAFHGDEPAEAHHPAQYRDEADAPARGRERLPGRRNGYTQKMRVGKQKAYLHTGQYPDGRLGEIFLDVADQGSDFRAVCNAMAQAVSIGLQYGVPLDEFVDAFVGLKFEPAGVVQGHDRIKMASSVLDAVFKDLAITYLKRDELAHVQPEAPPAPPVGVPADSGYDFTVSGPGDVPLPAARPTGGACPECGNFSLMQTGSCKQCSKCFWQSGCG